jgi:hypothetical protein
MPEYVVDTLTDKERRHIALYFLHLIGTLFSLRNVVRYFENSLNNAGLLEAIRLHGLRHNSAGFMIAQNVPPKDG